MNKTPKTVAALAGTAAILLLGFVFSSDLIDFPVYYAAGRSLLSGRTDLYAADFALGPVMDYRYPPFFLLALSPLSLVSYPVAAYIWYLLCGTSVVGCAVVINRVFSRLRASKVICALVALAVAQYFVMGLHYGNAHLVAVFFTFAALHFFLQHRELPAAALMSLAITIKLTPLLMLPYFAVRRRWKLLGATILCLLAINVVPSVYFGFRENNKLLGTWYEHVIGSQSFHEYNGPINLSLKGELRRYLSVVDYSRRVDGDVQYAHVNVAEFSRETTEMLWMVLAAVIVAAVLLAIRWRAGKAGGRNVEQPDQAYAIELGIMICLSLLIGPLTSKIYYIALLWPAACLGNFAAIKKQIGARLALYVLAALAAVNSVLPLLPGRTVQRLLLVVGVDFYVNLLMMATLGVLLFQVSSPRAQSAGQRTQDR
jgi:hypothetical protein